MGQYQGLIPTCTTWPYGKEETGGDEVRGSDEGGEEGAVDGLPPGPRLGQKRPMSWPLVKCIYVHILQIQA